MSEGDIKTKSAALIATNWTYTFLLVGVKPGAVAVLKRKDRFVYYLVYERERERMMMTQKDMV